jgi:maltose-binding protein MalE
MLNNRLSRKRLLRLAILAAALPVVQACGQAAAPSPTAAPAAPAPAAPAAPTNTPAPAAPAAAPTAAPTKAASTSSSTSAGPAPVYNPTSAQGKTFTVWGLDYVPHKERWGELLQVFEQKTGAKGKNEPQAWPIEEKVIAALAAGTAPDIGGMMGRVLAPLHKAKALEAVDVPVFKTLGIDPLKWFTPGAIGAYEYEGQYWGVPTEDSQVANGIIARLDRATEAKVLDLWPTKQGKDIFDSNEQLWDLAAKLQKTDGGSITLHGFGGAGWSDNTLFGLMKELGQAWYDHSQQKFFMDSDAGVQAMEILVNTPAQKLKIEEELGESSQDSFVKGKVAMFRANSSFGQIQKDAKIDIIGAMRPAAVAKATPQYIGEGGWGAVVLKTSKNKDVAFEFLKFQSTLEGEKLWSVIYDKTGIPAIFALHDDDMYKGDSTAAVYARTWMKYLGNTTYKGAGFGHEPTITTLWAAISSELRTGKLSTKEAAKKTQDQFTKHRADFYS